MKVKLIDAVLEKVKYRKAKKSKVNLKPEQKRRKEKEKN